MKKLTKRSLLVLVIVIIALIGVFAMACGDDNAKPNTEPDGPEIGVYYCDGDEGEYTVTLSSGKRFTLSMRGEDKTGGYSVKDDALTFKFDKADGDSMTAAIADNILTVVYNDSQMRFYKKIDFKVTFEVGEGSPVGALSVTNGKTVAKPASDPTRDGYVFIGWYNDDGAFESPFMFGTEIITKDTVLYARWEVAVIGLVERTVDFDLNYDGAPDQPSMQTKGGKLYNVPTPERAGYTFNGWWASSCEDPEKLSYILTDDTQFSENTTLYALWQDNNSSRLKTPVVHVGESSVYWDGIQGASTYSLEIINPNNVTIVSQAAVGTTNYAFDFAGSAAGEYTVKVTAVAAVAENNSETAVRCYHNKSLSRTTLTVVEPSTLLFSEVANAEKYYVTVKCGDENHNHTRFDNGSSTNFNFANCPMSDNGITFIVTAEASGYAPSTSRELTYKRSLNAVTGLAVDESTQTLKWNAVDNATNYIVSIKCGKSDHVHSVVDNGNKLTYSLKECEPCEGGITINVYPKTKGYISPTPTKLIYNKTTLAAPSNIRIVGTTIHWDPVANAESYTLRIGNAQKTVDGQTQFDLNELLESWVPEADYKLNIRANGDVNSLWSDDVDMRYYAMYGSVKYERNTVSWRHVIGAQKYEVQLNGKTVAEIENGVNRYEIALDKSGFNTVAVRYYDGADYSAWASINVYAYTVTFDTHQGTVAEPLYVAVGDKIILPTSELEGYELAGWYNTAGGAAANGAKYDDEIFAGTGDMLLHANWKPATYTVKYDFAGGECVAESGSVTFKSHFKLDVPTIADGTKAFAGWYAGPNGGGTRYTDEFGVSIAPWRMPFDSTIYAHWVATLEYTAMSDGTYSVGKGAGIGSVTHVTIPSSYNGKPVSTIAAYAFKNCANLTSLTIPDTVNIIATSSAFSGCSVLSEINVYHVDGNSNAVYESEDGMLIFKNMLEGRYELVYCPVARTGDYVVPSYITAIPSKAFASSKISSIVIPVNVTVIDTNAFYNCKNLTEITFVKGGTAPLYFGDNAFYGSSALTSITIPARAEEFAIDDTKGIFKFCTSLVNIDVEAGNAYYSSIDGVLCDAKRTTIIYCPGSRPGVYTVPVGINTIGNSAFRGCTKLTSIVISPYVSSIEANAFYGCSKITSVTFRGKAITDCTIGQYAFANCAMLADITFETGSRVVSLDNYAFSTCKSILSVTIPATMKSIGSNAFGNCSSLASVKFEENGSEITFDKNVFYSCTGLVEVYFPSTISEINLEMFEGCTNLARVKISEDNPYYAERDGIVYNKAVTKVIMCPSGKGGNIILPDSVIEVGDGAFKGNVNITGIVIGKNVTLIGDAAFYKCVNLSSVTFDKGGTEDLVINPSARENMSSNSLATFYQCDALTSIVFPSRLVMFGGFRECANLSRVSFDDPETSRLEEIGSYALYKCSKLSYFECPKSLKVLETYAFSNCESLTSIDLPEGLIEMKDYALSSCPVLKNITIPSTVKYLGKAMFANNKVITSMTLPSNIEHLGSSVFSGCENLREVNIECKITEIGESMFQSCASLKSIYIPNSVNMIATKAFSGCTSLASVTFEDGGTEDLVIANGTTNAAPFAGCTALEEVHLPSRAVTVGNYAFYGCTLLTEITFGENSRLKTIGNSAFASCTALTEITIPNTVANLDPTSATVAQVLGIGANAFSGDTKLQTVTFIEGGELPLTIGDSAFKNCESLLSVKLPARLSTAQGAKGAVVNIVPSTVFSGCASLETITVEDGGTMFSATDNVLYNSDKTKLLFVPMGRVGAVTIPNTVNEVINSVFAGNLNITSVVFQEGGTGELLLGTGTTASTSVFNGSSVSSITLSSRITEIAPYTFQDCSQLTVVNIPKNVVTLGKYAFKGCTGLQKVTFESGGADGLTIETYAFSSCTRLSDVYLPERITKIGSYAFNECTGLKYFAPKDENDDGADNSAPYVLPSNLVAIENNAFMNCKALTEIVISSDVKTFGNAAFSGCTALAKIVLPRALEEFLPDVFTGCTALKTILVLDDAQNFVVVDEVLFSKDRTELIYYPLGKQDTSFIIPNSVVKIASKAFAGNNNLTSVTVPNTVELIENAAFQDCTKLSTVTFAAGNDNADMVIADGTSSNSMFRGTAISAIDFPARLVYLGAYAFYKCEFISNVTFAENSRLNEIAEYAFKFEFTGKTSRMTSIDLPDSLTEIGAYAFEKTKLASIVLPSKLVTIGKNAFAYNELSGELIIPASVITIDKNAFEACKLVETLTFEAGSRLTTLETNSFRDMTSLTTITFKGSPVFDSLSGAFYGCTNVSTVDLSGLTNFQVLGMNAFANFKLLKNVTLPNTLREIGDLAFQNSGIVSLTIPASVTSIGSRTFTQCASLVSVTFENGSSLASIGSQAFEKCSALASIEIPSSVVSIGSKAFNGCSALESVTFGGKSRSALTSIGDSAFLDCYNLATVEISDKLTTLGKTVFQNCRAITSVVLPEGLTNIAAGVFSGCTNLLSVSVPSSVTSIDDEAFSGCTNLTSVIFADSKDGELTIADGASESKGVFYGCTSLQTVKLPKQLVSLGKYAFNGCRNLQNVTFADDVLIIAIGDYAFKGCSSFREIVIPKNLINIGVSSFEGCTSLEVVDFGEGRLTTIGNNAFSECVRIESIIIPESVVSIGERAFYNCRGLTEILLSGAGKVGKEAFYGCVNVSELNISGSVTSIGDNAFYGIKILSVAPDNVDYVIEDNILYTSDKSTLVLNLNRKIQSITIPASVKVIANYAFSKNTQLTTVTFAGSELVSIGDYAFNRCTKLQSITFPNKLEKIGAYAFQDCVQLTTVTFEEGRDQLPLSAGNYAFDNCTELKNIALPDGLTAISASMFAGTAIESVSIPKTVATVGENAFANCLKLKSVSILGNSTMTTTSFANCTALQNLTLAEGMTSIAANAFKNYANLTTITIPASVESIGNNAFQGCVALREVIFAEGSALSSIGSYAFYGCSALQSFAVPAGVETLGTYVFQNCAKLTTVTFAGSSVTTLPNYAFTGCAELSSITVPAGVTAIGTNAFQNCGKLSSVAFADSNTLKTIGAYAFDGCASLTSMMIPVSVTAINNYAFRGSGLTSVTIPEKMTTLSLYVFQNCASLAEVTFDGNKVTKIDSYAFNGCTALNSITIPNSVTTINGSSFKGSGLTSIIIPSSVTVLGTYTFQNCESLRTVEFKCATVGTSTTAKNVIGSYMFQNCTNLESVILPANIVKIGSRAFEGCHKLVIEIPAKVSNIENGSNVVFDGIKGITVAADNTTYKAIDNMLFSANGKTLHVVAGGPYETFEIPAEVTAISRYAFSGITVNSLSFAAGINYSQINQYAFANSDIKSVIIPDCIEKIDSYAFTESGLTNITIPATVERVGNYVFSKCTDLLTVVFQGTSVGSMESTNYANKLATGMFSGCSMLNSVKLPMEITTIASSVFSGCAELKGVTLSDNITLIDGSAFKDSGLTSIKLPSQLATIGSNAFQNTKFTEIILPSELKTINASAFRDSAITSITIPKSVDKIGGINVFSGCTDLTTVVFESGSPITYLNTELFSGCTSLRSVVLPNLTRIDTKLFMGCTSLTSITIPETVETINANAFDGTAITNIILPQKVKTIGASAFAGSKIKSVTIPKNVTAINANTFQNCKDLETVVFECENLAKIDNYAFAGSGIKRISLPKNVMSIGTNAFENCDSLTTVEFDEDSALTTIGNYAFAGSGITSITVPKNVKTIGANAFENCGSLKSVIFEEDSMLETIGNYAFRGSAIENMIIPKSVTSIGNYAFTNCASLMTVEFADGIALSSIGEGAFAGSSITSIIIPVNVTSIGNAAFENCGSLTTVIFEDGSLLSSIGERAFAGCVGIAQMTLPEGITSVGARAFDGWLSTQKIVMTASEDAVDEWNLQWESGSQADIEWPTEENSEE